MADLGTDIIRIHLVNGDARTVRFEEGSDSSVSRYVPLSYERRGTAK